MPEQLDVPEKVSAILRAKVLPRMKPPNISDEEWQQIRDVARARETQLDADLAAIRARIAAIGADDGNGRCRWCATPLGTVAVDGVVFAAHPNHEQCPGPPHKCDVCGHEYRSTGVRADPCPQCAAAHQQRPPRAAASDAQIEMKPLRRTRYGGGDDGNDVE